MTYLRILLGSVVALLAVAGVASAQCPECDDDGESNPENTYHSIDLGALENQTQSEALADADFSHAHQAPGNGFWSWLSLCLHAFVGAVEEALGVDLGVDGNAEAYVSEDGADIDATLYVGEERIDFDESAIGDVDGMTWEVMTEVNTMRDGTETPDLPTLPDYDGIDADVCLYGDINVAGC